MEQDSSYISKGPCDECGSSDANAVYTDGHTHCFSCGHHTPPEGAAPVTPPKKNKTKFTPITGDYMTLRKRHISEETCRKFGYFITQHDDLGPIQVANYYDTDKTLVGQHVRTADKDFRWWGHKEKVGLFGQHAWPSGQKRVVITEGEIDAMSLSQAMGNTWPVVSVPNGAKGAKKALLRSLEWLESFDEIVLCFDNDEPGQEVIPECAELFTPGKCKVATLPLKDANDMWVAGRGKELLEAVRYHAKVYRPDGIISGTDEKVKDYVINFVPRADAHYPWPNLDKRLYGMRRGEIVVHTAGTGIGKSTICREIAYDLGVNQGEKVGVVALEESVGRYGLHLASIAANRRLHLSDGGLTKEDKERLYYQTAGNGNYYLYDHWGSLESENLLSKLRYMVRGFGCNWIILDHISIVVSGMEDDNERKTIDVLMTRLRSLAEEVHCGIHLISHLSKKKGTSHEEGGQISLNDLRGSHGIAQIADITLGYERNQQDSEKGNFITVRDLKDRYSGETGLAGMLEYNRETGRVEEVYEEINLFTPEDPAESREDF